MSGGEKFEFHNQLSFRPSLGILGNYYIRKNEILDVEKIKNEVITVKLEDVNEFAKTKYLTENITILGNINSSN